MSSKKESCPNCGRELPLTKHHLVPRHKGGKDEESNYIWMCCDCATHLHCLYENNHLKKNLSTIDDLTDDPAMKKFGKFARKQTKTVQQKNSKNRKRS